MATCPIIPEEEGGRGKVRVRVRVRRGCFREGM